MTEPLHAHETFLATRHLATLRCYHAVGRVAHRILFRLQEPHQPTHALKALAPFVPGAALPDATPAALRYQARVVAALEARLAGGPGSVEECALGLGLALVDVLAAAYAADAMGLFLVVDGPRPTVRKILEESLVQLATARETAEGARARLAAAVAPDDVAVREACEHLEAKLRVEPPEFDSVRAGQLYRPGESYCDALTEGMRRVLVAFSFPVHRAPVMAPSAAEQAVLAELLARPDDMEPRLRWAALAKARNDPRADLVRAQLETRAERRQWRGSTTPGVSELERFLLREHPEWTDEVGSLGASSAQLHGGFVEEITVDAKTFLDRGDAWFAAAPIRWVHLTGARPHLDALLASGLLGRLLWIDLSGQELDDACIEKLATARCLGGVRALSLENNRITDAGVRTLWTAPPLRELQHCGLAGNPCSPLAVEELTPEYYAQYEWVSTELGVELAAAHGTRTWALRGFTDEPPTLDVLAP